MEYYAEVLELEKKLYKNKEGGGKQNAFIETSQKITDVQVKIADLKKAMAGRKQDVTEVTRIEKDLDDIKVRIAKDVLGVDITKIKS
jgi:hypothetical protein